MIVSLTSDPDKIDYTEIIMVADEKFADALDQEIRFGLVTIKGEAEKFDLRKEPKITDCVKKVDALLLWFDKDATFPVNFPPEIGIENHRVTVSDSLKEHFWQNPILVRNFLVRGLELQLGRPVFAIGTKIDESYTWYPVPTTIAEREQAPQVADEPLIHLVGYIWKLLDLNKVTDKREQEAQVFAALRKLNRFTVSHEQCARVCYIVWNTPDDIDLNLLGQYFSPGEITAKLTTI